MQKQYAEVLGKKWHPKRIDKTKKTIIGGAERDKNKGEKVGP